jgi:hypothetical protein
MKIQQLTAASIMAGVLCGSLSPAYAEGVPTEAILTKESGGVRVLQLGPAGTYRARQVARTPGVWEGLLIDDTGSTDGQVFIVHTSIGEAAVVQRQGGGVVHALPVGDGTHIVHVHDDALPGCGGALEAPELGDTAPGGVASGCGSNRTIDVLIRWTSAAEAGAGGAAAIRAVAEASVAITNHAYALSGLDVRLRAAHIGPVGSYNGDAGSTVLSDLANPSDGKMDSVHAERNQHGADLVALLTGPNPSYCGVAYLGGTSNAALGFSVTVWNCAAGNLTFAHEIGHNQGCCHAPGDGGGCVAGGVFPYSLGHRFQGLSGNIWRTFMAYPPGLRTARLSSPHVMYDGVPTGLEWADNARTISETAAAVSGFRCALPRPPQMMEHIALPALPLPAPGGSRSWSIGSVPPALTGTTVELEMSAIGDLGHPGETLSLRINGTELGQVLGGNGIDCGGTHATIAIPALLFNSVLLQDGSNEFVITASTSVNQACAINEMRLAARYWADPSWGGPVVCWGSTFEGQCPPPISVGYLRQVHASGYHTVGINGYGHALSWGDNCCGQCDVPGDLGRVTRVAGGGYHTMAIDASGLVRCWGSNTYGQSTVPPDLGECVRIAAGYQHSIALQLGGAVRCWGDDYHGQSSVPSGFAAAADIAAGGQHSIAVLPNGSVRCWGWNYYGQSSPPPGLTGVYTASGGYAHSVALTAQGTVRCWGWNGLGQCNVPANLGPVLAIAAGSDHTVALTANGTVRCWGGNQYGQSQVPSTLAQATSIAAGYFFTVATSVLPTPCIADLNGDGVVSGLDVGFVLGAWGPADGGSPGDINGDGQVDGLDLSLILGAWGQCQM